ncbi:MAG: hypothetical protein HQK56_17810 [Deltaproteobacteria bacterium]|nr:hypothetical protein [Deltaproteobacteria bacterium]
MELQTTVRDFPNKVNSLHLSLDTPIRVIIESDETPEQKTEASGENKGKWAKVAERFRREGNLKGESEKLNNLIREFKNNFDL